MLRDDYSEYYVTHFTVNGNVDVTVKVSEMDSENVVFRDEFQ